MRANTDHLYVTHPEQDKLTARLTVVTDWLADALDETVTRQTSHAAEPLVSTGKAKERPFPFHPAASDVAWDLANTLASWARAIAAARTFDDLPDRLTIKASATWLAESRHTGGLALMPDGAQGYDEILYAIDRAIAVVDRPRTPSYVGSCPDCAGDLWARPEDDPITCRTCSATIDRATNDQRVDRALRDRLFTAAELVDIVEARLGLTVRPKTIHELTRRRRPLEIRGKVPGRTRGTVEYLYRCGDVLDAFLPRQRRRTRANARLP